VTPRHSRPMITETRVAALPLGGASVRPGRHGPEHRSGLSRSSVMGRQPLWTSARRQAARASVRLALSIVAALGFLNGSAGQALRTCPHHGWLPESHHLPVHTGDEKEHVAAADDQPHQGPEPCSCGAECLVGSPVALPGHGLAMAANDLWNRGAGPRYSEDAAGPRPQWALETLARPPPSRHGS